MYNSIRYHFSFPSIKEGLEENWLRQKNNYNIYKPFHILSLFFPLSPIPTHIYTYKVYHSLKSEFSPVKTHWNNSNFLFTFFTFVCWSFCSFSDFAASLSSCRVVKRSWKIISEKIVQHNKNLKQNQINEPNDWSE